MAEPFDLESLVHIEQTFYDHGYEDGHGHGRIHGLIEGRALGREKGFEMWEELGFYEGFALLWKFALTSLSRDNDRAQHHIRHLLELIAQFPRVNPSAPDAASDLDIPKLFRQIRSRYRALCATLGVRPSLRIAQGDVNSQDQDDITALTEEGSTPSSVWKLDTQNQPAGRDLSF